MKLIIDIDKDDYEYMKNGYVPHRFNTFSVIKNGTPIPDNATNGEVVKTLFSNSFDNFCERTTWEWNRWWNAPYQKGGKE